MPDCLMASGSTLYVLQHIFTIDLPSDHSNGVLCMRSGVVDTLQMYPTFVFLAAKPMCTCTKTIVRNLIQRLLKPLLLGTSLVPRVTGYGDKRTRSVILSRDVKFDEESYPSCKSTETRSTPTTDANAPTKSTNLIPILLVPVDTSTTLPTRAETPTQSDNDEDDVEDLLDQTTVPKIEQPTTPPASTTRLPVTPKQEHPAPMSPPPRLQSTCIEVLPMSLDLHVPGGMGNELRSQTPNTLTWIMWRLPEI